MNRTNFKCVTLLDNLVSDCTRNGWREKRLHRKNSAWREREKRRHKRERRKKRWAVCEIIYATLNPWRSAMTWMNLNLNIHIMFQYLLFCPSATTVQDQRGMGGAAKQRKRGAGAERAKEERERGDPCTGRIKMQMSTYILYRSYTLYHISSYITISHTTWNKSAFKCFQFVSHGFTYMPYVYVSCVQCVIVFVWQNITSSFLN